MAILFGDFCLLLEKIARSSKAHVLGNTQGKYKQVPSPQDIFRTWLSALQHPSHFDGLLIFRLLFPEQDIRRRYGFKETLLARELSAALGFAPPPSLINWNSSGAPQDENIFGAKHGCFGLCLRDALQHRTALSQGTSSVTITQIDTLLDELACHCDFSSADVKRKQKLTGKTLRPRRAILHDLFSSISSTEAAYLCQIILRDLSPLLYPVPSSSSERSLLLFNASSWKTLDLVPALELWHWALPTIFKYKADLDAAFEVLSARNHALRASRSRASFLPTLLCVTPFYQSVMTMLHTGKVSSKTWQSPLWAVESGCVVRKPESPTACLQC